MNEAGVPAGILVAPLIPGVNDAPEQVAEIMGLAARNGAISAASVPLHLRGEVRDIFFGWLRTTGPTSSPVRGALHEGRLRPRGESRRLQEMVDGLRPRGLTRSRPRPGTARGRRREDSMLASKLVQRQDSFF